MAERSGDRCPLAGWDPDMPRPVGRLPGGQTGRTARSGRGRALRERALPSTRRIRHAQTPRLEL